MSSPSTDLISLFADSIRDNRELYSLADYGGEKFTYKEVGENILRLHSLFRSAGLRKGDKIALLGKNSATWGILYLATITYGAVIVPILPDFKPKDVHYIVTHSDSLVLCVEESIYKELDPESMPLLRVILRIPDLTLLFLRDQSLSGTLQAFNSKTEGKSHEQFNLSPSEPDDIAVISYTSGTTGFSKGVVLQHKSLLSNIRYAHRNMPLEKGDKILSFLPMAHTFGCTFEFLFPFTRGCEITFLNKVPSPTTIMTAFREVRPALILSVPLMIEKIYKSRIIPAIRKPVVKVILSIPLLNRIVCNKIRKQLMETFGGRLKELVIGGAPFNQQVEHLFKKIGFPFTVGYGMTECGPLISYASWKTTRPGASGRIVDELELRIESEDPLKIAGDIQVRGTHVMLGYYKNEEATNKVLDEDGWLSTGDLAVLDKKGNIYIKGRSKSTLLGPSGQNIYPEELESILNNRFMVMESLVVQREHKLIVLIYPDKEAMEKAGISEEQLPHVFKGYLHDLNHHVPKYMNVSDFIIQDSEFEKTPKRNIKRFVYQQ